MASGQRKTTRAKLDRERKLIERRLQKAAKKQARRDASAQFPAPDQDGMTNQP